MKSISQSALFEYSAEQLYNIVNDIECYPEFINGCLSATIITQDHDYLVGKLELQRSGVKVAITTENSMIANQQIDMKFIEGTLKDLSGRWTFKALSDNACKVELSLTYQFNNPLKNIAVEKLIKPLASDLINAIGLRCKQS